MKFLATLKESSHYFNYKHIQSQINLISTGHVMMYNEYFLRNRIVALSDNSQFLTKYSIKSLPVKSNNCIKV